MSKSEQIARQLEGALGNVKSPVDVIVLVDGSGSVNDTQFEIMRLCIRQLVDMFPQQEDSVRIGLIQFTSTIKIVCPLMSNMQNVKCSITSMMQMGGGTNARGAFENAKYVFDADFRPASRCVVFLTDGDCGDAVQVASDMRDMANTHIVAIGVNMKDTINLGKIASNNSYFLFNSFDNLREVFTYLNRTSTSPPVIKLTACGSHSATLLVLPPPEVIKFKIWQVDMFDFATNKWKTMSNSEDYVQCLYNLEANTKFKLRARVLLLNDVWTDNSPEFEFRTMIENPLAPIIRDPLKREDECKRLVDLISELKPNERLCEAGVTKYNLLFLGRMGAGKSSLLDSIVSAINGEYTVLAPFRASLETVTQKLTMYTVIRNKKREPQITIGDVYGWSETNYKNSELGYMLDGHVKSGYTETVNGFLPQKDNPHFRQNSTFNDKIHAIIVVVTVSTIGSDAEMGKLNAFYKTLTDRGYQPIFVLTKVDRLPDEVLIGKNENVLDSGIVESTLQNFSKMSNIPRASVFPIINYQGPYALGPDYIVEMLVLTALRAALKYAQDFLEAREDAIVEEAQENKPKKNNRKKKGKKEESEEEEEEEEDNDDDEEETENVSEDDAHKKKSKKKGITKSAKSPTQKSPAKAKPSPKSPKKQSPEKSPSLSPPTSPSAIMGLVEAVAYLGVGESELLELLESKELPGKRIGANWKITKDAIDNYLNA
jgi:excisionase family DNA binding protein